MTWNELKLRVGTYFADVDDVEAGEAAFALTMVPAAIGGMIAIYVWVPLLERVVT